MSALQNNKKVEGNYLTYRAINIQRSLRMLNVSSLSLLFSFSLSLSFSFSIDI